MKYEVSRVASSCKTGQRWTVKFKIFDLVSGMPEPGDLLKSSAFSHLFVLLQKACKLLTQWWCFKNLMYLSSACFCTSSSSNRRVAVLHSPGLLLAVLCFHCFFSLWPSPKRGRECSMWISCLVRSQPEAYLAYLLWSSPEDLQQAQKCLEFADKICWDLANLARWLGPFCVGCAKKPMWVPHKPRCQLGRVGIELCVLLGDCLQAIIETF